MKVSTARKINAAVWFVAAVALMLFIGREWSKNGEYTVLCFFASLTFHGGFCAVMGCIVDEQIVERFNRK